MAQANVFYKGEEGKLTRTGININNGTIDLTAANVIMSSGGQGQTIVQGGKIKADYIDAENILARQLTTKDSDNGVHVEISQGIMQIFGLAGIANWRFGVDQNGSAILSYYDNNGNHIYDLGPSGIGAIENLSEYWEAISLRKTANVSGIETQSEMYNLAIHKGKSYIKQHQGAWTTIYIYHARKTVVNGNVKYWGNDEASEVNWAYTAAAAEAADGKIFMTNNEFVEFATKAHFIGYDDSEWESLSSPYEDDARRAQNQNVYNFPPLYKALVRIYMNGIRVETVPAYASNTSSSDY